MYISIKRNKKVTPENTLKPRVSVDGYGTWTNRMPHSASNSRESDSVTKKNLIDMLKLICTTTTDLKSLKTNSYSSNGRLLQYTQYSPQLAAIDFNTLQSINIFFLLHRLLKNV